MSDGQIRVFPDSTGSRVDTDAITSGLNTVHRQRTRIGGVGLEDLATVTNNRLDVNIAGAGTSVVVATDPGSDGTIPLTGAEDVLVTYTLSSGTLTLVSFTWVADRQCIFRLKVLDNSVTTEVIRVTMNSGDSPYGEASFPVPKQIVGQALRTVVITGTRVSGTSGEAGTTLNGYLV